MAKSVAVRFSRASDPEGIDDELSSLWTEAGRDSPVTRALMANLVVVRERAAPDEVDLAEPLEDVPIEEVARRHPSRVIVLHHGGRPDLCGPVAARISVLLFGAPPARFGVEQIAVRSTCADVSLPSIVRRLARGDLPTSIWWTGDFSEAAPVQALATVGRQFVYDSRRWRDVRRGMIALASIVSQPDGPDLADVNWRRLTPLRQTVAQALGQSIGRASPTHVRAHVHYRPGEGALGWLLAGWLASRLEWPPSGEWPVAVQETRRGDEILSLTLEADPDGSLVATMTEHRILVGYARDVAPLTIAVPHESDADAIAAELAGLQHDRCLRETIAVLGRRFESR